MTTTDSVWTPPEGTASPVGFDGSHTLRFRIEPDALTRAWPEHRGVPPERISWGLLQLGGALGLGALAYVTQLPFFGGAAVVWAVHVSNVLADRTPVEHALAWLAAHSGPVEIEATLVEGRVHWNGPVSHGPIEVTTGRIERVTRGGGWDVLWLDYPVLAVPVGLLTGEDLTAWRRWLTHAQTDPRRDSVAAPRAGEVRIDEPPVWMKAGRVVWARRWRWALLLGFSPLAFWVDWGALVVQLAWGAMAMDFALRGWAAWRHVMGPTLLRVAPEGLMDIDPLGTTRVPWHPGIGFRPTLFGTEITSETAAGVHALYWIPARHAGDLAAFQAAVRERVGD